MDSVFSYIYERKAPTITYKRKPKTYEDTIPRPLTPVADITTPFLNALSSTQQHASPTELTPTSTDDEKENTEIQSIIPTSNHEQPVLHTIVLDSAPATENDIFDLPEDDNNDTQVELRVASSLHSKKKNKKKSISTNSQPKATTKKTPKTPSKPTPDANGIHHQKRNTKQTNTKTPPSFARTLSAPALVINNNKPIPPLPVTRNLSMLPRLPDTKRRKRNLVAQLKAANGECPDFNSNRFHGVVSDDDDNDNMDSTFTFFNQNDDISTENAQNGTATTSPSAIPIESSTLSNDYHDRMEQELADLMRSEFGQDTLLGDSTILTPSSSSTQRGSFIPENAIRAPVTYKRQNSNGNKLRTALSSNMPLTELDKEMERQIQYLLSGDF